MKLIIQCNKCGFWRFSETSNILDYKFICFHCKNKTRLRSKKGIYNLNFKEVFDTRSAIGEVQDKNYNI